LLCRTKAKIQTSRCSFAVMACDGFDQCLEEVEEDCQTRGEDVSVVERWKRACDLLTLKKQVQTCMTGSSFSSLSPAQQPPSVDSSHVVTSLSAAETQCFAPHRYRSFPCFTNINNYSQHTTFNITNGPSNNKFRNIASYTSCDVLCFPVC
jgi:hypothetical protein